MNFDTILFIAVMIIVIGIVLWDMCNERNEPRE
jgi:hypothetical protein